MLERVAYIPWRDEATLMQLQWFVLPKGLVDHMTILGQKEGPNSTYDPRRQRNVLCLKRHFCLLT